MKPLILATSLLAVTVLFSGCASTDSGARVSPAQQQRVARLGVLAQLPPYYGPKKIVAVMDFQNKSSYKGQLELGTGMADSLTDAIVRSERFIVVERQQIKNVLKEQDFAQTGRTSEASAPKIGRVLNTQAMIFGSVVDFSETQQQNQGFGYQGFNLNFAHAEAKVTIAIRLVDSQSGQVLDSQQVQGKAEKNAVGLSYTEKDFKFGTAAFAKTPLGQATQDSIDKAVMFICQRMEKVAWEGRVIEAKDDGVYINAGEQQGIALGDCFIVFHEDEAMVDPSTGLQLGAPRKEIGAIEVVDVQPKFSIAKILKGSGFARKNVVRFVPAVQVKGPAPVVNRTVPPPPDTPRVAKAREMLSRRDTGGALRELDNALKENPNDAAAAMLKVQLEMERRNYRAAVPVAAMLASLRPDDPAALMLAGRVQFEGGDYAGAVATLNRLLTLDANLVEGLVLRSQALAETGDSAGSNRDMRRAINLGYQPQGAGGR